MFSFEEDALLVEDREDLITVLRMRFGDISGDVIEKIYDINDGNTLQRLILAAANAPSFSGFLQEFEAGEGTYRLVGEQFNPLSEWVIGRDA